MASGPITSWEIDGETVETVSDFFFGGSQITADGDCSHEMKRYTYILVKSITTNKNPKCTIFNQKAETILLFQYFYSFSSTANHEES